MEPPQGWRIYLQWQCIRAIRGDHGLLSHYVAVFSDIGVLNHSQQELDHLVRQRVELIAGLRHDKDDLAIACAVIALAHSMEMKVLAEGVERDDQLERLRQLGRDDVQGYFIGRPVAAQDLQLA